jgi:hypothetical protein
MEIFFIGNISFFQIGYERQGASYMLSKPCDVRLSG